MPLGHTTSTNPHSRRCSSSVLREAPSAVVSYKRFLDFHYPKTPNTHPAAISSSHDQHPKAHCSEHLGSCGIQISPST